MVRDVLLNRFEKQRSRFLCDALEKHAKILCVHPDQSVDGWKHSDQIWLRLFSSPSAIVTADQAKEFLKGFGLVRLSWKYDDVANQIMEFDAQNFAIR
jgi:hypothetical protein